MLKFSNGPLLNCSCMKGALTDKTHVHTALLMFHSCLFLHQVHLTRLHYFFFFFKCYFKNFQFYFFFACPWLPLPLQLPREWSVFDSFTEILTISHLPVSWENQNTRGFVFQGEVIFVIAHDVNNPLDKKLHFLHCQTLSLLSVDQHFLTAVSI